MATKVEEHVSRTNGHEARTRRRLAPLAVLPTLCTLGNLVAGFAAIFYATKPADYIGPFGWSGLTMAGVLVFLGMFLDAIDGSIARLTRSVSELGMQLDSLADAVTFGVAPAFLTLMLVHPYLSDVRGVSVLGPETDNVLGRVIWGAAAVYVCCAALRLARYNIEDTESDKSRFRGLPTPGAAGGVASLVILHQHLRVAMSGGDEAILPPAFAKAAALGIPFVMLLCALGMVSSIPYVHIANRFIHGPRSFAYVVRLAITLVLAIWWFQETLAIVLSAYVLSGPVGYLWRTVLGRAEPDADPRDEALG